MARPWYFSPAAGVPGPGVPHRRDRCGAPAQARVYTLTLQTLRARLTGARWHDQSFPLRARSPARTDGPPGSGPPDSSHTRAFPSYGGLGPGPSGHGLTREAWLSPLPMPHSPRHAIMGQSTAAEGSGTAQTRQPGMLVRIQGKVGTPSQPNMPQGLGGPSWLWLSGPTPNRALGFDCQARLVAVII